MSCHYSVGSIYFCILTHSQIPKPNIKSSAAVVKYLAVLALSKGLSLVKVEIERYSLIKEVTRQG